MVYYGAWGMIEKSKAYDFDLIILHPGKNNRNLNKDLVLSLKAGRDKKLGTSDDIKVIAYVSIGEDENINREVRSNRIGYDGPVNYQNNGKIKKLYNGYRDWYLDSMSFERDKNDELIWNKKGLPMSKKGSDGIPDENGKWGSFYIDISNESWQKHINRQIAWLKNNLKVDGIFLDTIDTVSPWGNYGFLQKAMHDFLIKIRKSFPRTIIIMNRGLFLFEKYGASLSKNIDGLMFESYISEWDWYQRKALRHRWYHSNKIILNNHIAPHNKKWGGIKLFFLNYINPAQADKASYDQVLNEDSKSLNCVHYFSSPDLQRIYKPVNKLLEDTPTTQFRCKAIIKNNLINIDISELNKRNDFDKNKLTIRMSTLKNSFSRWPFENFIFDGEKFITLPSCEANEYLIVLTYTFKGKTLWSKIQIKYEKDEKYLDSVKNFKVDANDSKIVLSWDKHAQTESFLIRYGEKGVGSILKKVSQTNLVIENLKNNSTYFVEIKALKENYLSHFSEAHAVTPNDCTPPKPPTLEKPTVLNGICNLKFSPHLKNDVAGFNLYIDERSLLYKGLPMKLYAYERMKKINIKQKGVYDIYLTSYDSNNNESKRSKIHTIKIK